MMRIHQISQRSRPGGHAHVTHSPHPRNKTRRRVKPRPFCRTNNRVRHVFVLLLLLYMHVGNTGQSEMQSKRSCCCFNPFVQRFYSQRSQLGPEKNPRALLVPPKPSTPIPPSGHQAKGNDEYISSTKITTQMQAYNDELVENSRGKTKGRVAA